MKSYVVYSPKCNVINIVHSTSYGCSYESEEEITCPFKRGSVDALIAIVNALDNDCIEVIGEL